jgi:hypothetical protein
MGSHKRRWIGTLQPEPERGPLGKSGAYRSNSSAPPVTRSGSVRRSRDYDLESTKGADKPRVAKGMPGTGLTEPPRGKVPPERLALKPYWGKPAVRNFREGNGNVGHHRSPVRAIALPDRILASQAPFPRPTRPRVVGGHPPVARPMARIRGLRADREKLTATRAWE